MHQLTTRGLSSTLLFSVLLPALLLATATSLAAQSTAIPPDLRRAADSALSLNRSAGATGAWGEPTDESRMRQVARTERVAQMLRDISRESLTTADARLLHDNLAETINGRLGNRVCRGHLWLTPTAFSGWHIAASNWSRNVRVGTAESRAQALQRLRALPSAIANERALLQRGLDSGFVSSVPVINVVVRQIAELMPADVSQSPLFAPVTRDSSAEFHAEWAGVLRDTIYPAAQAYAKWLETEYVPRARADGSLTSQRGGIACYRAIMRERTSVDMDPDKLMAESRREIDRIHAMLSPLIRATTGADVSDGIRILKSDARFTFSSRDSVLAAYRAMTAEASTRIGRVVEGFAAESIVVIPYPQFQEVAGLPPSYQRAPDDRSRPAWFLVNLTRTERMAVANAAAHEAYPGHHLQRIAASQATDIHPVMRTLSVGAFSEGWGIYSEDLGAEMGLYRTQLDSIGHLVHLLDVAVAYYLDAGTHVRGWSRAALVDSMYVLGGRTRAQAADYADRHAATPGQLATYYVGYRVIREARADAERRLGTRFNLPRFNREVIRHGTITLTSLRAVLDAWVVKELAGAG